MPGLCFTCLSSGRLSSHVLRAAGRGSGKNKWKQTGLLRPPCITGIPELYLVLLAKASPMVRPRVRVGGPYKVMTIEMDVERDKEQGLFYCSLSQRRKSFEILNNLFRSHYLQEVKPRLKSNFDAKA